MSKEIDRYILEHRENKKKSSTFVEYLYFLMDKYHIDKASNVYTPANITRQLWSSIISEKSNPSLNVCIKIALAMRLPNNECKYLLKKAGYTLPSSSKFGLLIRYCFEHQIYNIDEVNDILEEYGYSESLIY